MNLDARYRLADGVAIRPERFGGLVYHYDNRRLYFLHSHELAEFVGGLTAEQPLVTAMAAFRDRHGLPAETQETMLHSLSALERIGLLVPVAS